MKGEQMKEKLSLWRRWLAKILVYVFYVAIFFQLFLYAPSCFWGALKMCWGDMRYDQKRWWRHTQVIGGLDRDWET